MVPKSRQTATGSSGRRIDSVPETAPSPPKKKKLQPRDTDTHSKATNGAGASHDRMELDSDKLEVLGAPKMNGMQTEQPARDTDSTLGPTDSQLVDSQLVENPQGKQQMKMSSNSSILNGISHDAILSHSEPTSSSSTRPAPAVSGTVDSEETSKFSKIRHNFVTTMAHQFSLEIMLKHRELQAMEEEGAKAQVGLEQLRRCFLIPYPGSSSTAVGASLPGNTQATGDSADDQLAAPWAPEWGIVEGPYSRHYSQWLLPDPRFDGISVAPETTQATNLRPQRNGPFSAPQSTNTSGLCLYRRKDGVLVRLECTDCHRGDFNSAQGFINHCRISHSREYASHEAAAQACGFEVDDVEAANFQLAGRSVRSNVSSGPYQNTRQQVSTTSTTAIGQNGATTASHIVEQPTLAPFGQIPASKPGTYRSTGYDSVKAQGATGDAPITDQPVNSTSHLRKFLKRKQLDTEDMAELIEKTTRPAGISDTDDDDDEGGDDDDVEEDDEERSELDDNVAPGRRRHPPSTTISAATQKKKKPSPGRRRTVLSKLPPAKNRVRLKISGFGARPDDFDNTMDVESYVQQGAGKDLSVIPRIPPRPEQFDSSTSDDQLAEDGLTDQDLQVTNNTPPDVANNGNRKRYIEETRGKTKKNRPA